MGGRRVIAITTTNRDMCLVDMSLEEFERLLTNNWEFVTATNYNGEHPRRVRCMHIVTWWEYSVPHDEVYERIAECRD